MGAGEGGKEGRKEGGRMYDIVALDEMKGKPEWMDRGEEMEKVSWSVLRSEVKRSTLKCRKN